MRSNFLLKTSKQNIEVGMLFGLVLSPIIVHQKPSSFPSIPERDYNQSIVDLVCPNGTHVHPDQELFDSWSRVTHNQLFYWFLAQAVASVLILFLTVAAFQDAPPTPPSISRQLESKEEASFLEQLRISLKSLISANGVFFLLFLVTSGVMIAMGSAIPQVMNEIIHPKFPEYDQEIAYLGLTSTLTSVVFMILFGVILGYTNTYYLFNVVLSVTGAISLVAIQVVIQFQTNFYWLYPVFAFFGITVNGYLGIAFEYGVEITYPLPEAVSASLIIVVAQVINLSLVFFIGKFPVDLGMWTSVGFTACAAVIAFVTKPKLRRVELEKKSKAESVDDQQTVAINT